MRILVAEDDLTSRNVLVALLKKAGHEVVATVDGASAWAEMQKPSSPRLAILDWMMPEMDGVTLCRKIRETDTELPPYIIMLTALTDRKHLCEGLNAGADDYIGKPCDPAELQARLRAAERILGLQDALAREARTDALTGLPNRAATLAVLERELARCARDEGVVGLAIIDIDRFKRVNDTHGHPTGDDVLRAVGDRCCEALRPYDTIGRYGGEEFLAIVPGCSDGTEPWERLRTLIASKPFLTRSGGITVSVSIGVACGRGDMNPEDLIAEADQALYEAKHGGRNRICLGPSVTIADDAAGKPPEEREMPGELPEPQPILIAEDDLTSRAMLKAVLQKAGHEVVEAAGGLDALKIMQQPDAPPIAVLDWLMPDLDGVEVCRKLRNADTENPPYIIMLTSRGQKADIVAGLDAGADDYLTKPFDPGELQARVRAGRRIVKLRSRLASNVKQLRDALSQIKTLRGILPICSRCKKIRNDQGYWALVEDYVREHSEAEFSHSICPDCIREVYPEDADIILEKTRQYTSKPVDTDPE